MGVRACGRAGVRAGVRVRRRGNEILHVCVWMGVDMDVFVRGCAGVGGGVRAWAWEGGHMGGCVGVGMNTD